MKAIKITALFLWLFIFVVIAFLLGQYLCQKDILSIFNNEAKEEQGNQEKQTEKKEVTKNIWINKQFAEIYFENVCEDFVKYLIKEDKNIPTEKTEITEEYVSEYVFYAISNGLDSEEYDIQEETDDEVAITESEVNSFAFKKFGISLPENVKTNDEYGYNSELKNYTLDKSKESIGKESSFSVIDITNSGEDVIVTFKNNDIKILVFLKYNNGSYIITDISKN